MKMDDLEVPPWLWKPHMKMRKVCLEECSATPLYSTRYGQNMAYSPIKGMVINPLYALVPFEWTSAAALPNQVSVQISAVMFRAPWQRCSARLWSDRIPSFLGLMEQEIMYRRRYNVQNVQRKVTDSHSVSLCCILIHLDTSRYFILNMYIRMVHTVIQKPRIQQRDAIMCWYFSHSRHEKMLGVPMIIQVLYWLMSGISTL